MPSLRIIKFPNPILQRKARPIEIVAQQEKNLLDSILETMYINQGVGLAAPQVGISKRAIVIDVGEGPLQLINPVIVKRIGLEVGEEGCLSLPDAMVKVKRAKKIIYKGLDKEGRPVENEAEGSLARAVQHEIDHLDGKLILNYANPIKRIFLKARLLKRAKASQ